MEKIAKSAYVHETATVDEGAIIRAGAKIWHYTHVMKDAYIGFETTIGQNCFIASGIHIGDHCKIQNNVSLYNGVQIDNDVFIGPSVVFTNVRIPRAFINRKDQYIKTIVCQGASIGANSTIICGATIGEYAMVGAGSVISSKYLPPRSLWYGGNATCRGKVCKCGATFELKDGVHLECSECGMVV